MLLAPDRNLLHYRLVEPIGEGGMGSVWKAIDTTLGREVAIKVLPEPFAADRERLARFEREAKLLASLNHPNIATVYGLHECDGVRFLAMELAPGEDLANRLSRGAMPEKDALRVAIQTAEALEAAHTAGVIHRDLKPANVFIKNDGNIKVLDFGLAKALDRPGPSSPVGPDDPALSPTVTSAGTAAGLLLGTAAYMSPEQARGLAADNRADIWGFGCLLFEMLTGKRPFGGKTLSDTLAAVLKSEPDWSLLPANTPARVRRVLRRCLAKERKQRLHHIADARLELTSFADDSDFEGSESSSGSGRSYRNVAIVLFLALIGSLGTFWSIWPSRDAHEFANPLAGARFTRVTDFPGAEYEAALSPDGRFVVFLSDRDGLYEPFVGQIGTTRFRKLDLGSESYTMGGPQTTVRAIGFNNDGSEIWLGGGPWRRMQSVPLLGGPHRNFLGEDSTTVAWSPDGSRVVYQDAVAGDPLFIAAPNGSNPVQLLAAPAGVHQHYPMWSADGEWIYFSRGRPSTLESDLYRVRVNGEDLEQMTEHKLDVAYPTPIDDDTVLYSARDSDGAGPWLWALDVGAKVSRRASVGLEQYGSVSASADGKRLVATVENRKASLWSVPILDRIATEDDAEPFADLATDRALSPRFAESALYYLSSNGSGDGLWRYEGGQVAEIWRGSETALLEPAAVSPDGRSVALVLRGKSGRRLHTIATDGTGLRLLSDKVDAVGSAAWSPDGRWIVTGGTMGGEEGLFKIPADGGEPERIVDGRALNPIWSPDGNLILYTGPEVQVMAPLLGVRPDASQVALPEIELFFGSQRMRFLPDGSGLVFMQGDKPAQDFWLLDLATMNRRKLTELSDDDTMWTFDITPDGRSIVFDRLEEESDIVLIELE